MSETTVGAFEAKTAFGRLLDRVEGGETIVITRHGIPVARLVPYQETVDREAVEEAIRGIEELARGTRLGGSGVRELIEEGRRW